MPYKTKRKVSYRKTDACGRQTPAIILEGNFLQEFGFNLGAELTVNYQSGKIEINLIGANNIAS
ncbi:MAG: hypothetical protein Q8O93_05295 [bacterium]|nr:hypothetical protein [bacterium]